MRSFIACSISLACVVGLGAACTSKASGGPPIDALGSSNPSGGGGPSSSGDAAVDDAATGDDAAVTPDAGGGNLDGASCGSLNCAGCCDSTGFSCLPGNVSDSCGLNGGPCQNCTSTGLTCSSGQCQ